MRTPLRITDDAKIYTITVQPGEVVKQYPLLVADLLSAAETVTSATADDTDVITAATGSRQQVLIDIAGPANGVQAPVRLTIHSSLGSVQHVALLVVGADPFAALATLTPNLYLRWRGSYQAQQAYLPYDLTLYGGIIYLALKGSTDAQPDISLDGWMAWAGTGGGGGGGTGLLPDVGGSGRYASFRMTWVGPGDDDWQVEVKGVTQ